MKYEIITHDQDNELADPTIKNFHIEQEVYCTSYSDNGGISKKALEIDSIYLDEIHAGMYVYEFPLNSKSEWFDGFIYPILRPLEDLQKMAKNGQLPSKGGGVFFSFIQPGWQEFIEQGHYDALGINLIRAKYSGNAYGYIGYLYWTAEQLRWLRDNQFCTADFRFASEVKHARKV